MIWENEYHYTQISNAIWNDARLTTCAAKTLCAVLYMHAKPDNDTKHPFTVKNVSLRALLAETCLSKTTFYKARKMLQSVGWIVYIKPEFNGKEKECSTYFMFDWKKEGVYAPLAENTHEYTKVQNQLKSLGLYKEGLSYVVYQPKGFETKDEDKYFGVEGKVEAYDYLTGKIKGTFPSPRKFSDDDTSSAPQPSEKTSNDAEVVPVEETPVKTSNEDTPVESTSEDTTEKTSNVGNAPVKPARKKARFSIVKKTSNDVKVVPVKTSNVVNAIEKTSNEMQEKKTEDNIVEVKTIEGKTIPVYERNGGLYIIRADLVAKGLSLLLQNLQAIESGRACPHEGKWEDLAREIDAQGIVLVNLIKRY